MKSGLSLVGLCLAAAVLVGGSCGTSSCVQFDAQSIRAQHDEARDRVDLLFVYRDLTTTGDAGEAVDQLEEIRNTRKTFTLVDNLLTFRLEEPGPDARGSPAEAALASALVRDVEITNGLLWRDDRGRLCASQLIRVSRVTEVLAAANVAITENFRHELGRATVPATMKRDDKKAAPSPLDDWFTAERLQRFVTAGENGYRFLGLRGSAIVFSLPVAGDDAAQLQRAVVAGLRHDLDARNDDEGWWPVSLLARNRLALDQVGGDLQIVLGDPTDRELRFESPSQGLSGHDLGAELAARGWTVAGPEGEAQASAAYDAFREQH